MATALFLAISICLILLQYKREKTYLNMITVLVAPYALIVFVNNFIMSHFGYYKVSDRSLYLFLFTFVLFFVGTLPVTFSSNIKIDEEDNIARFEKYNMGGMCLVGIIVGILGVGKLLIQYSKGSFSIQNFESSEGMMGGGPIGHLVLMSQSIVPILFLYWTYNKKKKIYLITVLLIGITAFSTFVKYNIIGIAVTTFMFVTIYKKSILKKSIVVLVGFAIAMFVLNYTIGFVILGVRVNPIFYVNHFWSYVGGSIINSNNIFTTGMNQGTGLLQKILICTMGVPRMFVGKLTGITIFEYDIMPTFPISNTGEVTNVIDAFSWFYPSKGSAFDVIVYFVFVFVLGFIFSSVYMSNKKNNSFNTTISVFLTYFVFFSFFGTFYINAGPWEILVYTLIVPRLFYKRRNLVVKINRGRLIE